MRKHHPKNEIVKHRYLGWLEDAQGRDRKTGDMAAAALASFEASTGHKDFAAFHLEQARKFKRDLLDADHTKSGKALAKSTVHSRLAAVRAFFNWLADQPGYKSKLHRPDFEYFSLSANDSRIAKASREGPFPSLDQVRRVVLSCPHETALEKRDRALIAFALLSGARIAALASLQIRHVDLDGRSVFQDARDVNTKNRKTFTSHFFPMGDDLVSITAEWIAYLHSVEAFGPCDPLFPKTRHGQDANNRFVAAGLSREPWKRGNSIREIFRRRFEAAGVPYFNPHSLRKTIMQEGYRRRFSPEEEKAWSQNFGHDDTRTTRDSYGPVSVGRQAEILAQMARNEQPVIVPTGDPPPEVIDWVQDHLRRLARSK